MKAGKLTEILSIERAGAVTVGASGKPTTTWHYVGQVRAEKVEQETVEYIQSYGASDEEIVVFRVHSAGFLTSDRVVWRGETYNIKQISSRGRTEAELRCARVTP